MANERAFFLGHYIAQTGYELLLADMLWYPKDRMAIVNHMIASRVEGVILSGPPSLESPVNSAVLKRFAEANIPTVLVSSASVKETPTVNSDFAGGFYRLAQHLIEVGHRRLTLLLSAHPESSWHGVLRCRGFTQAIQDAGGVVRAPEAVESYRKAWDGDSLQGEVLYYSGPTKGPFSAFDLPQEAMNTLLDRGYTADAILASNDDWAAGVISVCLRRGIDVPRQLAVTGFDNSNLGKLCVVPITTASQESDETCRIAVELLLKRMAGSEEAHADIILASPIIIRESSGGGLHGLGRRKIERQQAL